MVRRFPFAEPVLLSAVDVTAPRSVPPDSPAPAEEPEAAACVTAAGAPEAVGWPIRQAVTDAMATIRDVTTAKIPSRLFPRCDAAEACLEGSSRGAASVAVATAGTLSSNDVAECINAGTRVRGRSEN